MKKILEMKKMMMAVGVSLLMFTGLNAQILTDYQNVAETSYQTAGQTFRLYVYPDTVYSPSYNATNNTGIDANARWTWTYPGGLTGDVTSGSAVAQNYVEFTNPAAGTYTISVVESNTLASCSGSSVNQAVTVVAAPSAAVATADTSYCGNQAAMSIGLTFTENVPSTVAAYAFSVEEKVENIDPSDVVISTISDNTSFVDFPTTGKLKTSGGLGGTSPNFTYSFNTSALNIQNGLRTRYTYTLHKASDAPGAASDGVISAISQKSDYIAGTVSTYAFTDNQVIIVVNPAPTTGPIFHIPNNYAY